MQKEKQMADTMEKCKIAGKCGGCQFQGIPYKEQLKRKQKQEETVLNLLPSIKLETV